MNIKNSVVLVTGANRGIGQAFVGALVQTEATKIYATARNLDSLKNVVAIAPERIVPFALDVTMPDQIAAIAKQAQDVTLLINNAGVAGTGGFFTPSTQEMARWEMETNYFGTLDMIRGDLD